MTQANNHIENEFCSIKNDDKICNSISNQTVIKKISETKQKASLPLFSNVVRPMQYLGSKYRALPLILSKLNELYSANSYVLDLFSGSSVVSQAINIYGMHVIANDIMHFNQTFANALLNINREEQSLKELDINFEAIVSHSLPPHVESIYRQALEEEANLLSSEKTEEILSFYNELPQAWRLGEKKWRTIKEICSQALENRGKPAIETIPLIASYYAGSYFSLQQALDLDKLRSSIEIFANKCLITAWQKSLLLTCLMNTISKIVHSAGKHFAQPIKQSSVLGTKIMRNRFYEDRSKNVILEFSKCFKLITSSISRTMNGNKNIALAHSMESLIEVASSLPKVSVLYADPPYTAQQYSRYYHIPEIVFNYEYPEIQLIGGKPTAGLYPVGRSKSRFCSKKEALFAFEDMFYLSKKLNSHLVLSYSASKGEGTGNERMISLDNIIETGNRILTDCTVEITKFNFSYRQLNKASNIIQNKDDKEYLVVFKLKSCDKQISR